MGAADAPRERHRGCGSVRLITRTGLGSGKSPWEEQRDGWSWQIGDPQVGKLLLMTGHCFACSAEEGMELI